MQGDLTISFAPDTLVLVPGSSKVAVGFFCLYLWGPEFAPTAHGRSYF